MARERKSPPPAPPAAAPEPVRDPLASHAGRATLEVSLTKLERQLINGPDGLGWKHNETKRAAIEEIAAFLKAVLALLPS